MKRDCIMLAGALMLSACNSTGTTTTVVDSRPFTGYSDLLARLGQPNSRDVQPDDTFISFSNIDFRKVFKGDPLIEKYSKYRQLSYSVKFAMDKNNFCRYALISTSYESDGHTSDTNRDDVFINSLRDF